MEERISPTDWRYEVHALRGDDPSDTLELMETFSRKCEALDFASSAAKRNQEFTSVHDRMARHLGTQVWVYDRDGKLAKTMNRERKRIT